ncbi:hypothetical protein [Nocardia cyriacigeorgica]|uniref:hypothetical protein n=1 Tax=Nocardia cyriacigeorgica TaxID=135487 RepID=UPI0018954559|nr:hypothetical protein [Nocardia cyriacigeorgica]MBF6434853.1 hypothetical protein [Nocardia cyriacigeorgica]MBF6455064.1 hypothetical protein [Nocardia cyriacigeorgica]MBF6480077.1 hypothetical protein [Nocardia cyriacigeorgica]MBF6552959.1 hypothetical protein [Nocardia cyriacigeorgica]
MRFKRFTATAFLTIGVLGASAGVVHAHPAAPAPDAIAVHGTEQGIGYTAAPTADGTGVSATVAQGGFALTADGKAVTLADGTGRVVATLPMAFVADGHKFGLAPQISDAGRTLTLTPVGAPAATTDRLASFVDDDAATLARKQHNAGVGALIGAGIGAVLGFFLGGVGALVTVPIGAGIGALIGFSTP